MSTQVQQRGGTTAQHAAFTGAAREITIDTDKNTVVVHDGATAGGHPLATEAALAAATLDLATLSMNMLDRRNNLNDVLDTAAARTNLGLGYTDWSSVSSPKVLPLSQKYKKQVTGVTSVPLYVDTSGGDGIYRITIQNDAATLSSAQLIQLSLNDTTATNRFYWGVLTCAPGTGVSQTGAYTNGLILGYGNTTPLRMQSTVEIRTKRKSAMTETMGYLNGTGMYMNWVHCWMNATASTGDTDQTTVITSLGTLTFSAAFTGVITVEHIN